MGVLNSKHPLRYSLNKGQQSLATQNSAILFVYFDYLQCPISGIIGITSRSIQNFSGMSNKVVAKEEFAIEISCADFNPRNEVIVLGFSNGLIKLIRATNFQVLCELHTPDPVMYLNSKLPKTLFVGCSNSALKTYTISTNTLIEQAVYLETDKTLRLFGLECNQSEKKLFVGYNNEKKSIIHQFVGDTSKPSLTIKEEGKVFKQLQVLDKYKMIMCLEEKGLGFFIYNYNESNLVASVSIPKTTNSFTLLANTRQLRSVYISDIESIPSDDAEDSLEGNDRDIVYLFGSEGVMVILLHSFNSKGKRVFSLIPKDNYELKNLLPSKENTKIIAHYIDPVTDKLLLGLENQEINIIERTIRKAMNPSKDT